jgi:predicted methyltransferase
MKTILLTSVIVFSACSGITKKKTDAPASLKNAVESELRTEANKSRDKYRHPAETLAFFGLKPNMTIVEIYPGAGWYMEIISPYVAKEGKYVMAMPYTDRKKAYMVANEEKIMNWMKNNPEISTKMTIKGYDLPTRTELGPENSVDMVVTFRNVHNWITIKAEKQAFASFFKVLKPGGVLGVVEHRELPNKIDPLVKSGYVREKDVIKMAEKAGFKLVAKSEINANPKDTKNHPAGVWTLPPSLRLGDKEKEKYLAIGESDRMTLKFIKPVK